MNKAPINSTFLPICTLLFLTLIATALQASHYPYSNTYETDQALDTLPHVFMIGQNEIQYEDLVANCSNPLLSVCKDSMDLAYRSWMGLLSEMEQYAEKSDFDIKGIKIWLNVFWDSEGTIKHLVYFPKPNSRNMDFELLTKFLDKFVDTYQMDSVETKCYSHYGSATFPTFADIYLQEK